MTTSIWKTNKHKINDEDNPVYQVLRNRGVTDPKKFLKITKKKLHNPYLLKDMKKAVKRIMKAIENNEPIGIFGDYDADGVSSTATWVLVLRELDADVTYFVPDRFTDGYGVNNKAIDNFHKQGVKLMITCDTGITAIDQIDHAKSLGMDVIVTDHHEPQETNVFSKETVAKGKVISKNNVDFLIPDTIVVNPKRPDDEYPFKGLAGVGVTFKILTAVADKLHLYGRAAAYQYMDIVALGTFADMMEVVDENRVIGRLGLDMMSQTSNRGLYQLIRANKLDGTKLSSRDVGWTLAPCINAAGRIVSAVEAVEMLISDNKMDAYRFAKKLVKINEERKELTKQYQDAIIKAIEADQEENPTAIIVHYHPEVPEGIVGLVAGRIKSHFYKPSILLTDAEEDGVYKGSGRSVDAFDMFNSLMPYSNMLENFGGHKMACGLSIKQDNLQAFKEQLEFFADSTLSREDLQPKIYIDAIVDGDLLDMDFVKDINRLEPFGAGNHRPIFMMPDMKIIKAKPVGDSKNHLWALMSDGSTTFSTIGFFLYDKYEKIGKPKRMDIAFFPSLNEWPKGSGKFSVQLQLEDFRKAK